MPRNRPGSAAEIDTFTSRPAPNGEGVLDDPLAVTVEDPDAEGEQRFISVGIGSAAQLLVVVYAERNGDYRLISARPATKKERKLYES